MATRAERRVMQKEARKKAASYPKHLTRLPKDQWPGVPGQRLPNDVLCSQRHFVQVFHEDGGVIRLSVNRTEWQSANWQDGMTWDELMDVKRQAGFGGAVAVELYPDDARVVNVSNMRHLWVLSEPPTFMWGV